MNKLRRNSQTKVYAQNPSLYWMKRQCARWLINLYDFDFALSDFYFLCHGWVTGDLVAIAKDLKQNLKLPSGRSKDLTEAKKALETLNTENPRVLHDNLEYLCSSYPILQKPVRSFMYAHLLEWFNQKPELVKSIFPRGFKTLFNLDEYSLALTAFAWGLGNYRPLEKFFEDTLELQSRENEVMLAAILGIPVNRIRTLRDQMEQLGILDVDYGAMMRVTDSINQVLCMGNVGRVQNFFCKSLPGTDVPLEQFQIGEEEKKHALNLMRHNGPAPAHLLLYGPPGTGKSSFASQLAKHLNLKAWGVSCNEKDSARDRRVSLIACINLALARPGSLVVVDEAEKVLDTDMDNASASSKAWLNELLERKHLKIIWITNNVDHIDPAVRRRFSFSIHFHSLGVKESIQMWNNVANRLNIGQRFPEESREHFARTYPVPVAVMESAARQAKTLAPKKEFCACTELILKSHMQLSNDGFWENEARKVEKSYDPRAICTSVPAETLVSRLKTLRSRILSSSLPGMGNILFYGPPGTGKTAFANYLAKELDMECISERASNILGPYVGETERRIAQVFSYARQQKALLLIDEVDSFLSSRENAQRSWEQTMVNEFLTALENYNGLCVCTTNFRTIIDSAAIRRFPFKVEFCYASPERLLLLFEHILAPLSAQTLDERLKEELCAQKCLAPGDFRSVLSQFWLENPEEVTCEQLVRALIREQKLKLENSARKIGFNQ